MLKCIPISTIASKDSAHKTFPYYLYTYCTCEWLSLIIKCNSKPVNQFYILQYILNKVRWKNMNEKANQCMLGIYSKVARFSQH